MEPVQIPTTMRAWTITSRGPPSSTLQLKNDVAVPALKSDNEVLVKVSHVALHPGSSLLMHIIPLVFRKAPFIAETDFSGVVVAEKKHATQTDGPVVGDESQAVSFPIGSKVFGSIPVPIHLKGSGVLAEYVVADNSWITHVPKKISLSEAACLSVSTITAVDVIDLADPRLGQNILINAPCGGIGSIATQLIRRAVGSDAAILGICSKASDESAQWLGCNATIDYRADDDGIALPARLAFWCQQNDLPHGFDAIIDCHGSQELWQNCARYLKPSGVYATVGPKFPSMTYLGMVNVLWNMLSNMLLPVWLGGLSRTYKQAASFISKQKLEKVSQLVKDGVIKPVVGKMVKFEEALEAYEVVISGHSYGKVVIEVDQSS